MGAREYSSSYSPSSGRPKCDIIMTCAPAFKAIWIVGNVARIRISLVILPFFNGTFRSSRSKTRLPVRFRSDIFIIDIALPLHDVWGECIAISEETQDAAGSSKTVFTIGIDKRYYSICDGFN